MGFEEVYEGWSEGLICPVFRTSRTLREWLPQPKSEPMKWSQFSEEQMIAILREADRSSVTEVAKKHKVSEQASYTWRKRFGELQPADIKRLRALESENAKLKKLVAERDLEIETMKEINRRKW